MYIQKIIFLDYILALCAYKLQCVFPNNKDILFKKKIVQFSTSNKFNMNIIL